MEPIHKSATLPIPTTYPAVITIGYEGKTIAQYVEQLVDARIEAVFDVRKNALSRKKGFSKNALRLALHAAGIDYHHLPNLGIPSNMRRDLRSREDYEELFDSYRSEILPFQEATIDALIETAEKYERIALTCFEADHTLCHRSCVAQALQSKGFDQVSHA